MGIWSRLQTSFHQMIFPQHWKQDEPSSYAPIKYHPEFGFEDRPRKLMTAGASDAEMSSANLEPINRDECANFRIAYRGCLTYNSPLFYRCNGFWEELEHCYLELRVHDMKEFEREKRLNARERRIAAAAAN